MRAEGALPPPWQLLEEDQNSKTYCSIVGRMIARLPLRPATRGRRHLVGEKLVMSPGSNPKALQECTKLDRACETKKHRKLRKSKKVLPGILLHASFREVVNLRGFLYPKPPKKPRRQCVAIIQRSSNGMYLVFPLEDGGFWVVKTIESHSQ